MKSAKCTSCGANIEVDETHDAGICPYCKTAFVTEKVINNFISNNTTNISNTFTKIVNGKAEDDGEEEFARGLSFLKLNKFWEARLQFAKAIKKSPDVGKYYFYFSYAVTQKFQVVRNLVEDDYYMYSDNEQYYSPISDFFAVASEQEKTDLGKQYGVNLNDGICGLISDLILKNAKTGKISEQSFLTKDLLNTLADENLDFLWEYARAFNENVGKFQNLYPYTNFHPLFEIMKERLKSDDFLKFQQEFYLLLLRCESGCLTIENTEFVTLPECFKIENPNIVGLVWIKFAPTIEHIIITPNIKHFVATQVIKVLEIADKCDLDLVNIEECRILVLPADFTRSLEIKSVDIVYAKNPDTPTIDYVATHYKGYDKKTVSSYIIQDGKLRNRPIFRKMSQMEDALKLFTELYPDVNLGKK